MAKRCSVTLSCKSAQQRRHVRKLSHESAISNLRTGAVNPVFWARPASENLEHLSCSDEHRLMHEAKGGKGAALAI